MLSKYEEVRRTILAGIREGRWLPGEQLPPLPELAAACGASRWASERALLMLISEGVLDRRPKKGTFVRRSSAEDTCAHAPIAVMGVNPRYWLEGDYLGPMMGTFAGELEDRDWVFLHYQHVDDIAVRLRHLGTPFLISVTPATGDIAGLERMEAAGLQVLCLGAHVPSTRLHYIAADNAGGIHAGLRYLAQLGHRRVALLICVTDAFDTLERVEAYQRGVRDLGLEDDPVLLVNRDHPDGTQALVQEALAGWLASPHPPTAIFSGGLGLTTALLSALAERGVRVPDDLSILGFDDSSLLAHLAPPLTTIRQPLAEMGQRAAQILPLLALPSGKPVQLVLPTELVVRASCARPRGGTL